MIQSKLGSLIETVISTAVGFIVSFCINMWVLPALGVHPTVGQNILMVIIFTVASLIRGYILRRIFNKIHLRRYEQS